MTPTSKTGRAGSRITAAAFALCLVTAVAADARAADGNQGKWYIGANIPVMFIDNTETSVTGTTTVPVPPPGQSITTSYTTNGVSHYGLGFRIAGVVGYYVLPNLRIEGELFYGFARVKKTVYSGTSFTGPNPQNPQESVTTSVPGKINQPIKGNTKMLGAMVNAWYDIPLDSDWSPFIGGGIGVFHTDFGSLRWNPDDLCIGIANTLGQPAQPGCGIRPADEDTVLAFQVGGGIGYRWTDATTLQFSYKFQMAPGLQFDGKNQVTDFNTKTDMKIHLFEVGLRYKF